jgi:hypothetical protein
MIDNRTASQKWSIDHKTGKQQEGNNIMAYTYYIRGVEVTKEKALEEITRVYGTLVKPGEIEIEEAWAKFYASYYKAKYHITDDVTIEYVEVEPEPSITLTRSKVADLFRAYCIRSFPTALRVTGLIEEHAGKFLKSIDAPADWKQALVDHVTGEDL